MLRGERAQCASAAAAAHLMPCDRPKAARTAACARALAWRLMRDMPRLVSVGSRPPCEVVWDEGVNLQVRTVTWGGGGGSHLACAVTDSASGAL